MYFSLIRLALGFGAILSVPIAAAGQQDSELAMLAGLSRGEWTLEFRDGSASQRICVRSGKELIQLRHKRNDCNRFVIEDSAKRITVQYTCRGDGYGRTDVRKENGQLVQIESQGIAGGVPFVLAGEARYTGACKDAS